MKKTEIDAFDAGLSFACAYKELLEKYDLRINDQDTSGYVLLISLVTNGCLSAELYLKYLLGSYPKTHRLSELKKCLAASRRELWKQVEKMAIEVMKNRYLNIDYCEEKFENDLIQFDDAFCEWRYFFEYNEKAENKVYNLDFLTAFLLSLEAICTLEHSYSNSDL